MLNILKHDFFILRSLYKFGNLILSILYIKFLMIFKCLVFLGQILLARVAGFIFIEDLRSITHDLLPTSIDKCWSWFSGDVWSYSWSMLVTCLPHCCAVPDKCNLRKEQFTLALRS